MGVNFIKANNTVWFGEYKASYIMLHIIKREE
jgi:hypothetical protein